MTQTSPALVESEQFGSFWRAMSRLLRLSEVPPTPHVWVPPQSDPLEEPVLCSLKELIGQNNCSIDISVLQQHTAWRACQSYSQHGLSLSIPQAVVYPENEHEIAALMVWAAERDLRLLPWGGGSDLLSNKIPSVPPFLSVDLSQMKKILEINRKDGWVRVQAGMRWVDLEMALESDGLTTGQAFAHTEATVGGSIATGAVGMKMLGYGSLPDNILQIRAITPAGPLTLKHPMLNEPDWRGLMMGTRGAWGIITEAILRVYPRPTERVVFTVGFGSWEQAIEGFRRLFRERCLTPTWARIIGARELSLFAPEPRLTRLQALKLSVWGEPSTSETQLIMGLEGNGELMAARRHRIEILMKEAGGRVEISEKVSPPTEDLCQQIQPYLPLLWERNILACPLLAAVSWGQTAEFRRDWEEALRSVVQATGRAPGLVLTTLYPTENVAIFNTLLLGIRAQGNEENAQTQLETIHAVAHETLLRWKNDGSPSLLLNQTIRAAGDWLDPDQVMLR